MNKFRESLLMKAFSFCKRVVGRHYYFILFLIKKLRLFKMCCVMQHIWYNDCNHIKRGICMKTASVNVRIQENIKEQAEKILSQIGLSRAVAIDLFYRQIIMNNGIPFSLTVPQKQLPIRETMTEEEFQIMMDKGMQQVKNNESQDMENILA